MLATQEFVNFYEILPSIVETSDPKEIKDAIREQRQVWNKRAAQADPVKREQAQKRVRDLAEAERVLLNPERKRAFDQERLQYRPQENMAAQAGAAGHDWLALAREYYERGNAPAANYAAREAITQNGANHEAWAIRANSSFLMGENTDAGFEFREAIRLRPDNPDYHFDYGDAYAALGAFPEARGEYEAALRLVPGNPLYRTAIANVDLKQNGNWVITSQAQIDVTKEMSGRALSLKFDDEQLRRSLQENLTLADKAAQVKWVHSNILGWSIALLVGLAFIAAKGLGLIIVAAVVVLYTVTHRMPTWKHNAKTADIARQGI